MMSDDAMTAVLRHVRILDARFRRHELYAPWGGTITPAADLLLHHVTEGAAFLHRDGKARRIEPGGAVLVRGIEHVLSQESRPPAKRAILWHEADERARVARRRFGGTGSRTVILCASARFEGAAASMLLSSIAPVVVVPDATTLPGFSLVLQCIRDEAMASRAGSSLMLVRFAEMLLLQVIRAAPDPAGGWMAALADPNIARALRAIYDDPARAWTVGDLAQVAGMSRSAFARSFRSRVGESPIRHLTAWRMALARAQLRAGERVADVASAVGYSDEAAFNSAFRREVGIPPGQFRTEEGAASSS